MRRHGDILGVELAPPAAAQGYAEPEGLLVAAEDVAASSLAEP